MHFSRRTIGYAAIGERLYFVCGGYKVHHDVSLRELTEYWKLLEEAENPKRTTPNDIRFSSSDSLRRHAEETVKNSETKHLDVPTYNLRTRAWETKRTPCLNAPKPNPVAFAYDGKLFALRGHHDYKLVGHSPPFEFLNTNCPSPCWTDLPAPPFDMEHYSHYILDEANGIVFFFFSEPDPDSNYLERVYCCQLNLKEKPYVWCKNEYKEIAGMARDGSEHNKEHLGGCIVDDIVFSYEYNSEFPKPVILGRYVGNDNSSLEPWVIDGLDVFLEGKVNTSVFGFLNHIGKYRFCLITDYCAQIYPRTEALYFLVFDLVKEDLPNELRMIKTRNGSKSHNANKFKFKFKFVCDRAFQVPDGFFLKFCKHM